MRVAILAILLSAAAFAGTNNLPVEHAGTIQLQHVNKFQQAFSGDLVPRDTNGNVGDLTANLGQTANRWSVITGQKLNLVQDAAGNAISITSPAALASAYTLKLPTGLPSGYSYLTLDGTGTIATKPIVSNYVISTNSGGFSTTSGTAVPVTNLSVTITTSGRPVVIALTSGSAGASYVNLGLIALGNTANGSILVMRGGSQVGGYQFTLLGTYSSGPSTASWPSSSVSMVDIPAAGTYTYSISAGISGGGTGSFIGVSGAYLIAYEL